MVDMMINMIINSKSEDHKIDSGDVVVCYDICDDHNKNNKILSFNKTDMIRLFHISLYLITTYTSTNYKLCI